MLVMFIKKIFSSLSNLSRFTWEWQKSSIKYAYIALARRSSTTCVPPEVAKKPPSLSRQLQARIKAMGPITIADYMKEVLTNPLSGYYMNRDVFGQGGDFITSPEINQLFGEMISIWFLGEWQKVGSPTPFQIVELGPGRGTLMKDILKVFHSFGASESISIHLVEMSPHLSLLQAATLGIKVSPQMRGNGKEMYYQSGRMVTGTPVYWYRHVQDVPRSFSCILANEFFDALPIHKFQKTDAGWREILVDLDSQGGFRYVISRSPTPASTLFIKPDEKRNHVEVSPASAVIIQHLASRLEEDGGFALIADYGHDGTKTDTFRAFSQHKLHDPLVDPGSADLTADVDFSYLRSAAEPQLLTFGPVNQGTFLSRMGINLRLQILLEQCTAVQQDILLSGYHMMVDEDKMGARFKLLSMFPAVLKEHLARYAVIGFSDKP